ncbi:MAG: hypothetical protein ACYCXG_10595 [Acidiferrobacter sp.]
MQNRTGTGRWLWAILFLAPLAVAHQRLTHMTMAQKRAEQSYFRAHALGFSQYFGLHHPGPYWMLKQPALNFTATQRRQETALKNAMAHATLTDNARLRHAYAHYAAVSAVRNVHVTRVRSAVDAVGRATTALALEMVPYHRQAYHLLTTTQKAVYWRLVAARVRKAQAHTSP